MISPKNLFVILYPPADYVLICMLIIEQLWKYVPGLNPQRHVDNARVILMFKIKNNYIVHIKVSRGCRGSNPF